MVPILSALQTAQSRADFHVFTSINNINDNRVSSHQETMTTDFYFPFPVASTTQAKCNPLYWKIDFSFSKVW
jgi:hypothetical protein